MSAWDAWSWFVGPAVVGVVIGLCCGAYVRRRLGPLRAEVMENVARLMALATTVEQAEKDDSDELRRMARVGANVELERLRRTYKIAARLERDEGGDGSDGMWPS